MESVILGSRCAFLVTMCRKNAAVPVAFALLAVAMVCAAVAGAAWTTAQGIVTLDEDAWKTDPPSVRVGLGAAERCNLYWGVNPDGAAAGASSAQDIDMADPAVQQALGGVLAVDETTHHFIDSWQALHGVAS